MCDKSGFLLVDALFALMIVGIVSLLSLTNMCLKNIDTQTDWEKQQEHEYEAIKRIYSD